MSKQEESKNNQVQHLASPERRKVLKKAAYLAPTIVVLGVAMPISNAYAFSVPTDPPPSNAPYDPAAPSSW